MPPCEGLYAHHADINTLTSAAYVRRIQDGRLTAWRPYSKHMEIKIRGKTMFDRSTIFAYQIRHGLTCHIFIGGWFHKWQVGYTAVPIHTRTLMFTPSVVIVICGQAASRPLDCNQLVV